MSLFRHSAVGLGVSFDRMACAVRARDSGRWRVHSAPLAPTTLPIPTSGDDVVRALDSLLPQSDGPRTHVHVVLASGCLREWIMDVPAGVQSLDELRNLAAARFTQLHGQPSEQWLVTADWTTRGPMLCTAVPRPLMQALQLELARRGLRSSISTTLCSALGDISTLPAEAWLCIRTLEFSALLLIRQRALHMLRILRIARLALDEQLASLVAELKRASLRCNSPQPTHMYMYDCSQGAVSVQRVDGVEIVPLSSRALAQMDAAQMDADSTIAACLGAVL